MPIVDAKRAPSLKYFRTEPAKAKPERVDEENRIINGYAVITRGEALGHGVWIDRAFLSQVVEAGNSKEAGIKARFTHPGLSSDGLGKYLGKAKDFRLEGDIVRADLHFSDSASRTPSGDLAGYVMALAIEDPDQFGASIVFSHDEAAELEFFQEHTDDQGDFITPDDFNQKNLPHARLKALRASDIVDEPAANPGGFFSEREEFISRAEDALSYIFSLSQAKPSAITLGVDADRAKHFVERFLERHGLSVSTLKEEVKMTPEEFSKENPDAVQAWQEKGSNHALNQITEKIKEFQAAFVGREAFALQQLAEGKELIEAKAALSDVLLGELSNKPQVIRQSGIQFDAGARETVKISAPDYSNLPVDQRAEKEWSENPQVRSEFDSAANYASWLKIAPRIKGGF